MGFGCGALGMWWISGGALGGTGYDDVAVEALLATVGVPDVAFKEYDESAADDVEYHECPACGHKWPK
jgi:hypothetical protein